MTAPTPTSRDGVAWITGASSGIGYELALELAQAGWTVAATARSADKLAALVSAGEGRIHAFAADVSDDRRIAETVENIEHALGPIALAVLNAGVYLPVMGEAPDMDAFKTTFNVNVIGVAACLAALNPRLCGRRLGHVAIVSSATGFGGMPTASAYGASKAALINMAACLYIELERWNVKIQVITPGFVETPAQDDNHFPKPMMISANKAARNIVKGLKRKTFEVTFPKGFTMPLQILYALPKNWCLAMVRKQTKWHTPLPDDAKPGGDYTP